MRHKLTCFMLFYLSFSSVHGLETIEYRSRAIQNAIATRQPEEPGKMWSSFNTVLIEKEIAPAVYAVFPDDAREKNIQGKLAGTTSLYAIGKKGVAVIDSQPTGRLATELIGLIREKTELPILYVINTGSNGDHSFGNQWFALPESRIENYDTKIIQHPVTEKMIKEGFKTKREFELGFAHSQDLDELKYTPVDILVNDNSTISLELGEKRLEVMHLGFAQTAGNLFVWLPDEKILVTGNAIGSGIPLEEKTGISSLPWLLQGRLNDYLTTMKMLRERIVENSFKKKIIIVPGHGYPTDLRALDFVIEYAKTLQSEISQTTKKKLSVDDAKEIIKASMKNKYGGYAPYEFVQDLNIAMSYQSFYEKQNR